MENFKKVKDVTDSEWLNSISIEEDVANGLWPLQNPTYDAQFKPASSLDKQVGGGHYKDMKIQPIEFIVANDIGYREGNVIKYTCRHKSKNGKQDIEKAIHYLQMILEDYSE